MKTMKKNRLTKTLAVLALSCSIFASGGLLLNAQPAHAATVSAATADKIIATGKRYMGTRYQFGATAGNTSSFDCSSFIQYIFQVNGVELPRSSEQQAQEGTYVPRSQLQPGDLVFFYSPIHHVAVYIGDGKIMHTYGSPGVTITDLNSGWWDSHYTTARRVLKNGTPESSPSPSVNPAPAASTPSVNPTPAPVTAPPESTPSPSPADSYNYGNLPYWNWFF